jgi:hypothetical protein
MCIYTENGYTSREEYLSLLRLDYGEKLVNHFIPRFQPSQDFDGLIRAISDAYHEDEDEEEDEEEEEEEEEEEDDDDW